MATIFHSVLTDPTGQKNAALQTKRLGRQAASAQAQANALNSQSRRSAEQSIQFGMQRAGEFGKVEKEAVDRNLAKDLADAQQSTLSRGLYNTTILDSLKAGAQEDANFQKRDIAQKQAMLEMQQANQAADLYSRPVAQAPDPGLYANLASGAAQYGASVPGTISSAVAASNNAAPGGRPAPVASSIPGAGRNPYQQYQYPIGPINNPKAGNTRNRSSQSIENEVALLMAGAGLSYR